TLYRSVEFFGLPRGRNGSDATLLPHLRHSHLRRAPPVGANSACPNSIPLPSIWEDGASPLRFEASERPNGRADEPRRLGIRSRKDLIESETPKGSARRKAREGEYEGSVRSLRTQQRAKSQRQIC